MTKEKLLLHSCCGPCSSYVLSYLKDNYDITLVYYNPNIYPKIEYFKRYKEQERLIKEMFNDEIKILKVNYFPLIYYLKTLFHHKDKEGGVRCHLCYQLRMKKTAKLAKKYHFDCFTTTLSVSPYKNSDILNNIGKCLEKRYNIKYLEANFKKNDGYKKSIEYSKEYNLYRQNYCGCKYSIYKNKK